jgi:hypothetical protein
MRSAFVVFALAAVAQWLVPLAGIRQHDQFMARGTVVRLECKAHSRYDPLRGRFLHVWFVESGQFAPHGMPERGAVPVWATLVAGDDGISRIQSLSVTPVAGPTVIRLVARYSGEANGAKTIGLKWPFNRFFLGQRLAVDAASLVNERYRSGKRTVAEIRVLDGRALLTDVLVDGVSIRDVVRRRAAETPPPR